MRVANRVLAVALALAVLAGGLLLAAEISLAGIGRGPWVVPYDDWYDRATATPWDSSGARWLSAALLAAGVSVLLLQVLKPPPRSLALRPGGSEAGISRRSVEKSLARAAGRLDGVSGARARLRRNRAAVVVSTSRRTGDLQPRVATAAAERLGRLGLAEPLPVNVEVDRKGNGR